MKTILRPVRAYADDKSVGSGQWPHVRQYLQVIREAGITLNLEKCDFRKSEVKLVGHIVGSGCRKADPQRTQAMNEMTRQSRSGSCVNFLGPWDITGTISHSLRD